MNIPTAPNPPLRRLIVIGLGLIGGSLAAACRRRNVCESVWGVAPQAQVRQRAVELGVVHQAFTHINDIAAELGEGDVIFIAVPTLSVASVLADISTGVDGSVTVTDGASVKGSVVADARRVYGEVPSQLVPGHPIAGSERSGIDAANADLYERHRVILTPLAHTDPAHLARVEFLWRAVGAEVLRLEVQQHDEILAATSHLPHAIAFSLVDTLAHDSQNQDIFRYAAGGFRDFTRIASSDATMWRDIMLANSDAVVKAIDLFSANLGRLRQAVVEQDERELLGVFTRAKAARDHFTKMLQQQALVEKAGPAELDFLIAPNSCVKGEVQLPGDKSITHRAVMLGALAEGTTEISGFLNSEDALATLQAFRDMGVVIVGPNEGRVTIHGVGLHGLQPPAGPLYLGNSATSMRLLAGILAGQSFDTTLTGGPALLSRSMARIVDPLTQMGANIATGDNDCAPLRISGGRSLRGMHHHLTAASAQVKSCLLLAGLYAKGVTRVTEPFASRDHTERMLQGLGYPLQHGGNSVEIAPGGTLRACQISVPADLSLAALLIVAATITPGSELCLKRVGVNPSRLALVTALQSMGADIAFGNLHKVGAEPVADILVRHAPLKSIVIAREQALQLLDELPVLLAAAACAEGTTVITGLKLTGNFRIQAMLRGLVELGVQCRLGEDMLQIQGGVVRGGEVDSGADARVALALTVVALRAQTSVRVRKCGAATAAFPDYPQLARRLGISLEPVIH